MSRTRFEPKSRTQRIADDIRDQERAAAAMEAAGKRIRRDYTRALRALDLAVNEIHRSAHYLEETGSLYSFEHHLAIRALAPEAETLLARLRSYQAEVLR